MFRRRREPDPPARIPHPDGGIEQQLQHILMLRAVAEQQRQGVADTYREVDELRRKARTGDQLYSERRAGMADKLAAKIPAMEARVLATMDQITKLTGTMNSDDLSFL